MMAAAAVGRRSRDPMTVYADLTTKLGDSTDVDTEPIDESMGPLEESGGTVSDEEEEPDETVADDMERFEASFKNISQRYRLINRIGEGTFSTVYKAEDLLYDHYQNNWDFDDKEHLNGNPTGVKQSSNRAQRPRYVAIKKIYVTSSPLRILNELELLHDPVSYTHLTLPTIYSV